MASVYTVAQVTSYISHLFEEDFALKRISIQGEISNCKKHSGGHLYFTLKDETSTLSCVMFASNRAKLTFIPSEGMRVIARGSVRIYERDGVYQLYVTQLEPAGVGEWFRLFEERKQFEEMAFRDIKADSLLAEKSRCCHAKDRNCHSGYYQYYTEENLHHISADFISTLVR